MSNPTTRICVGCNVDKPLTEFHRNYADSLGRQRRCKPCNRGRSPVQVYKTKTMTIVRGLLPTGNSNES